MSDVVLDTTVLLDVLRDRTEAQHDTVNHGRHLLGTGAMLVVSPVTVAELHAGVRPHELDALEALIDVLDVAPIDRSIGRLAGAFMAKWGPSHGVVLGDALIAATAVAAELPLWTASARHYPMPEVALCSDTGA